MPRKQLKQLQDEFEAAKRDLEQVGTAFAHGSIRWEQVAARYNAARDALDFALRTAALGGPAKTRPKPTVFRTAFGEYSKTGRILGQGATGRVFEVSDEEGRKMAIKCFLPENVTRERAKRFRNEIQFCARNTHPNLVTARDWGLSEIQGRQVSFYVMPFYLSTLRKLLQDGLQPSRVLLLFLQLLEGLGYAHEKGVWHRDLKPENVFYDPDADRIVIGDFGIAHFAEPLLHTLIETGSGDRLANFQYAAPEQRARKTVDDRADIYALGLMLNEMFTGELLSGTGHKRVGSVAPDYAFLDAIIDRMARQAPEDRPSIEEIKRALSIKASPVKAAKRPRRTRVPRPPVAVMTMAKQIEELQNSSARIKIAPIIPTRCAQDEFQISRITRDVVELNKLGSGHQISVPIARIKEILPEDPHRRGVIILLNGRLQWISVSRTWRFMPETPPESELPIGFGKLSPAEDQKRIDIENTLKTQGRPAWLVDERHLGNALAQGRQVIYDDDGKYFSVPNGPNRVILISAGP